MYFKAPSEHQLCKKMQYVLERSIRAKPKCAASMEQFKFGGSFIKAVAPMELYHWR